MCVCVIVLVGVEGERRTVEVDVKCDLDVVVWDAVLDG